MQSNTNPWPRNPEVMTPTMLIFQDEGYLVLGLVIMVMITIVSIIALTLIMITLVIVILTGTILIVIRIVVIIIMVMVMVREHVFEAIVPCPDEARKLEHPCPPFGRPGRQEVSYMSIV